MKYPWPFLAATAALSIGSLAGAQSADERKALGRSINQTELVQLGVEFQNNFNAQELRVMAYLASHPEQSRSFQKDGRALYLSRIDAEGNPVYIATRSIANGTKSNRESGALIKADQLYSGGSIGVNITGVGRANRTSC